MCNQVLLLQVLYFQARLQRGNVHLKQAQLNEAKEDYQKVVRVICLMQENSNLPFKKCVCMCACISNKPHHSLLSPFRMTAGSTLLAAPPFCHEAVSYGLVQYIAVDIRFLPHFKKVLEVFSIG